MPLSSGLMVLEITKASMLTHGGKSSISQLDTPARDVRRIGLIRAHAAAAREPRKVLMTHWPGAQQHPRPIRCLHKSYRRPGCC